eukprot:CAMPEP_0201558662 /NCGR_PEP_ID=MMETSP0173_2-20130828/69225_1 /ASSEMBLY_ACC=CAM_ASM_000268 /TAXON_ID=218659 /ORGANISM="Vexillifera sp., Strain DIVA3 564/2" /LENGTH=189 /DNA_ID=CAMNT_0047972199 /DNA_START=207 /DNA_END=772 /DNA_ORIENTATION=-
MTPSNKKSEQNIVVVDRKSRGQMKMSLISGLHHEIADNDDEHREFWAQFPLKPDEAIEMRAQGKSWTNQEIRQCYLRRVDDIPKHLEGLAAKEPDATPKKIAKLAFDIRHRARVTCRAMMDDPERVAILKVRDLQKYNNVDGPTFEWLITTKKKKYGDDEDSIYQSIIESSQRTNNQVNAFYNAKKKQT